MPSPIEGRRGRVTLSIHIPMQQMEILDRAIAQSGQSTSRYVAQAALWRAEEDLKDEKNNGTA